MNRTASLLLVALTILLPPLAARAVPDTIAFSARVADNGRPLTGTHAFTFRLFDAPTGGTELWKWSATDTPASLTVSDGVVTYALGSDNAIPTAVVFNGLPVYLEVSIDSTPLTPRMPIHSAPYAIRAGVAESTPWSGITGMPAGLADGAALSCQTVQSANSTTAASSFGSATIACPAGTLLTGGGHVYTNGSATQIFVWRSFPSGNQWSVSIFNSSAGTIDVIAYARCCSVQ